MMDAFTMKDRLRCFFAAARASSRCATANWAVASSVCPAITSTSSWSEGEHQFATNRDGDPLVYALSSDLPDSVFDNHALNELGDHLGALPGRMAIKAGTENNNGTVVDNQQLRIGV